MKREGRVPHGPPSLQRGEGRISVNKRSLAVSAFTLFRRDKEKPSRLLRSFAANESVSIRVHPRLNFFAAFAVRSFRVFCVFRG
jgi:hypothetical protein